MVFTERTEQGGSKYGYTWHHTNCHTMKANRAASYFAKSKLPLNNWVFLLYLWSMDLWSMDVGVCTAALQAEVSEVTADVY